MKLPALPRMKARICNSHTTGRVYIKSDGTPWRPIIHIRDITTSILSVLEAPREMIHNEIFNVGRANENYRISELAQIVVETVPGCHTDYAPDGGPVRRCYRMNCDKIYRLLPGFRPQGTARKGAQELYGAYRAAKLTFADIESGRSTRIAQIKKLIKSGELDSSLHWTDSGNTFPTKASIPAFPTRNAK